MPLDGTAAPVLFIATVSSLFIFVIKVLGPVTPEKIGALSCFAGLFVFVVKMLLPRSPGPVCCVSRLASLIALLVKMLLHITPQPIFRLLSVSGVLGHGMSPLPTKSSEPRGRESAGKVLLLDGKRNAWRPSM